MGDELRGTACYSGPCNAMSNGNAGGESEERTQQKRGREKLRNRISTEPGGARRDDIDPGRAGDAEDAEEDGQETGDRTARESEEQHSGKGGRGTGEE